MKNQGAYVTAKDSVRTQILQRYLSGKISRQKAAQLMGLSERSVSRLATKFNESGVLGLVHANRGRAPTNKLEDRIQKDVMKLVSKHYYDMNMTHCLETLERAHGIKVTYPTFRRWCHKHKLVKRKRRRRGRERHYRDRMPSEGYLIQFDGSPEKYNGRDEWTLIIGIDDATSKIPYGEFFKAETTLDCLKVTKNIVRKKGIPVALYTDKAGWSGGQKRTDFSQFKRACEELGITVIFADSPEAKGRVERAFQTIQDRIIPELRLNKIKRLEDANEYLQNTFLPKYWNQQNTVRARDPESAFRAVPAGTSLEDTFCIKVDRAIGKDKVFQYKNEYYLIQDPLDGPVLYGAYVVIHIYPDRTMKAFFRGRLLNIKKVRSNYKPLNTNYLDELDAWVNDKISYRESARLKK